MVGSCCRAERVHALDLEAWRAAQVLVVLRFDTGLSDRVAGVIALLGKRVQLFLRDLADVAEHVRRELAMWVVPQRCVVNLDAGEVVGSLLQVSLLQRRDAGLDRYRRQEVVAVAAQRRADLSDGHFQDTRELAQLAETGVLALGEIGLRDLNDQTGDVDHERTSLAVPDRSAGRRHAQLAALVVLRGAKQLLAVQDLQ